MIDAPSAAPRRRTALAALALTGLLCASYLAAYQLGVTGAVWDPVFDGGSVRVLDSAVSRAIRRVARVPDGALGVLAYAVDLALALLATPRRSARHPWLVVALGANSAGLAAAALLLIALQAFVVHAWCFLCLVSAGASLTIGALAIPEVPAAIRSALAEDSHARP